MKLIYGRSGTGKSEYVYKDIKKKLEENCGKIYIITPEQFSFTAEKRLLETIDDGATLQVEVLSFARMAHRVISETMTLDKDTIDKAGKAIIIYETIEKNKKKLRFLGNSLDNVDTIITQITEFKKHNISVEMLEEQVEKTQDQYLKAKLNDMLIMYKALDEKISENFIDENNLLNYLYENIEKSHLFDDAIFYIDEFAGFTKQEYSIIEKLEQIAKELYITICTDELSIKASPDADIFYDNKQTVQTLCDIAERLGRPIDKDNQIRLENNYRFKNEELAHLEKNIFSFPARAYDKDKKVENIKLFLADNQYAEVEHVATEIFKLVRDKGYKYSDISVICNNIAGYSSLCKAIFAKYEIPVFIDEEADINHNIIIKFVLGLIDVLAKNFTYESVFNYLKTGVVKVDDIFEFENYCLKWGINRSTFYKEKWNFEKADAEKDVNFNDVQTSVIMPLIALKEKIKENKSATQMSEEFYNFIVEILSREENNYLFRILDEEKNLLKADEIKAREQQIKQNLDAFKLVSDLLLEVSNIFKDQIVGFDEYENILKIGLSEKKLGQIPATQDKVLVGDVNRSKSHKVRAVFIIGVNDGSFPSVSTAEGFFNDKDRENLKEEDFELAKGTKEKMYEENFNIYKVFSTAEEKVFVSYASSDNDGKALRKSLIITKLNKVFPGIVEESGSSDEVLTKTVTFNKLLNNIENDDWKEVYKWYKNNEQDKLADAIDGIRYSNVPQKIADSKIKKLYGNTMQTSVSKLEQYSSCPYKFFLQYALRVSEEDKFDVSPLDTGSFMHDVLDKFFKEINNYHVDKDGKLVEGKINLQAINEESEILSIYNITEEMIEKIVNDIVDEKLQVGYKLAYSSKNQILVQRLKRVIVISLKYIIVSLSKSSFEVLATEASFDNKPDSRYPAITVELDNGEKVQLVGKIDRIDIAQMPDGRYLRIIDYKSSEKNIDMNSVLNGLQLQLLTYVDAACKNEDADPAGALYFNLIEPKEIKKTLNIADAQEIENEVAKNYKMKGLVLGDVDIIKAMDPNIDKSSKIIPVEMKSDGTIGSRSSTVSRQQFEELQKYALDLIKEISQEILSGNIELRPYYTVANQISACHYCPYNSICHFDSKLRNNNYRIIEPAKREDAIAKISEKVENKQ